MEIKPENVPQGMTMEQAEKIATVAMNKIIKRQKARDSRLLKSCSPNEIWNHFSRSNIYLPRYDYDQED